MEVMDDSAPAQWFYNALAMRQEGRILPSGREWLVDATLDQFDQTMRLLKQRVMPTATSAERAVIRRNVAYSQRLADKVYRLAAFRPGFQQANSRPLPTYEAFIGTDGRAAQDPKPISRMVDHPRWRSGTLAPYRVSSPAQNTNLIVWLFTPNDQAFPEGPRNLVAHPFRPGSKRSSDRD